MSRARSISSCTAATIECLDRREVPVRGVVPPGYEVFAREILGLLAMKQEGIWRHLRRYSGFSFCG
ncbi:hypothetical protein HNQ81_003398 [Desulfoprunum benzoelyticum]|uniref:Uncharacterized protein n=1 Tax=Desulfoprunum benzoelyticum TaxID=1506996 RepID=A0A840UV29_9BACT|nr:hypothetical protein [Desulfoprunum benzoelyticum]